MKNEIDPNYSAPPGNMLKEWMLQNNVYGDDLAERLGLTLKELMEVVTGGTPTTGRLAEKLEIVTGIRSDLWEQMDTSYRTFLEHKRLNSPESEADRLRAANLAFRENLDKLRASHAHEVTRLRFEISQLNAKVDKLTPKRVDGLPTMPGYYWIKGRNQDGTHDPFVNQNTVVEIMGEPWDGSPMAMFFPGSDEMEGINDFKKESFFGPIAPPEEITT